LRWSVPTGLENPPPAQVIDPGRLVVKFLRFKNKVAVLERAKNLRGMYIFLNEDCPEAVRQRKALIPAMKAARACGDIAYICDDRLIVHPSLLEAWKS
jgi:predicted RNA-binding protein YlxR (DUF448 family)